ncbi:MAG: universal stress protein [Bacteroidetes bacterium]|nr:universal stress protein [Bacteroidota bacterium]
MDFSRESSRALSVAVKLAGLTGIAEIVCIHCYTVPVGNLSAGKRFLEMSEAMRDLAKGRLTRLLKRVNTAGVVTRCVIEQDRNPSDGIVRTAVREKADMIVVGTRGRKNLAAALLVPSVSEAIATKSPLPVLAVKLPGEGLTLRRAFMSL